MGKLVSCFGIIRKCKLLALATFTFEDESGKSLGDIAKIDTMVTVVDVFQLEWPGVIRSKGIFWLATRLKFAGYWSQAGAIGKHQCAGHFWSAVSKKRWPEDTRDIDAAWEEPHGNCRQEIVLIGTNMDREFLTKCSMTLFSPRRNSTPPQRSGRTLSRILSRNGRWG